MSAMDGYGRIEFNVECPLLPFQRHPFGLENELMEILWQDGEAFLQIQTHRKPSEQVLWDDDHDGNPFNCLELLSGIQTCNLIEPNKLPDVEEAFRFPNFNPIHLPVTEAPQEAAVSDREQGFVTDSSVMTMELSSSPMGNEVNKSSCGNGSNAVPAEMDDNSSEKVTHQSNSDEKEQEKGFPSNDNKRNKRKIRDEEESESPSEDSQMESPRGKHQSPHKSIRRSRVAEVHNLSERRRRDRINEKMRTLQKLIPHSNKSDKASMLDDAIDYMKSLQLQLQWWMGNGMAQMRMLQQCYYNGSGMRAPTLPSMQNFMYFSKVPMLGQAMNMLPPLPMAHGFVLNPFSYQNQMQMPPEQNPELHFVPTAQTMNAMNFSSHANQALANGNSQMNQ